MGRVETKAALFALLAACGEPAVPADAGEDAGGDLLARDAALAPPTEPAAPAEPALPAAPLPLVFAPCPEGWSAAAGACEPWPDGRLPDCAAGEAALPGLGCQRIGSACPADGWPVDLPATGVLYVRAGASSTGADGTRDRPYPAIQNAVDATTELVAVASGTYDEVLRLDHAVEIRGACAGETVLAPTVSPDAHPIEVVASIVSVRDFTVRAPGHRHGVFVGAGAEARLEDLWVDGSTSTGIFAAGRITGARVVVEDIAPDPTWGYASAIAAGEGGSIDLQHAVARGPMRAAVDAWGASSIALTDSAVHRIEPIWTAPWNVVVFATDASTITLVRSAVELTGSTAIEAKTGSMVTLEDVVVRDTGSNAIVAAEGGRIDGHRVLLERNRHAAALAQTAGAIALTDAIVRENRPDAGGWGGVGAWARDADSTVRLERALLEANTVAGVFASEGGRATLIDVVIRGTHARPGGTDGFGVMVSEASSGTLERCEIVDNRVNGIDVGGDVELTDVVVRATQTARSTEGNGLFAGGLGRITGQRVRVEGNIANGIKLWNGGTAILTDLVVRDTQPNAYLMGGYGIWVTEGSHLELTRTLVERNHAAGIGLDGHQRSDASIASSAVLRDIVVRETESDELLGLLGNALRASNGASLDVERAVLEDSREAAISVQNPGSRAVLADVAIRRTRVRGCVGREVDPCSATVAGGCGLAVFNEGSALVNRFLVREGALCGVMVAEGSMLELHEGEVSANPIGANVQIDGYDLALLTDRVRYVDNERNYDGARLPVPDESLPTFP